GFGDFLIHFSPTENQRFDQADLMRVSFTGAEANVCAALALWGKEVQLVTKVPDHALARRGLRFFNGLGVRTDHVAKGTGRMGIYFLESGYSVRPSSVIYDRSNTLFTLCEYEDYDWDAILADAEAFYLTGITPSLSEELLCCCKKVLAAVRERNIPVFYDVNLRPTICDIHRSREIFAEVSPYITHLIGNEEHLKQLLMIDAAASEDPARLRPFTETVMEKTGIGHVAVTVRRTPSASKAVTYAAYGDGKDFAVSREYCLDVVDRVGSGDAFSAGIVYSVLNGSSAEETVSFAAASCALKHTIHNDINYSTVEEIRRVMQTRGYDVAR
ncbi:MAG: sugar kinase, partial [Oscillospiraceae bacterium]|nr:sugar kinase [Oscillospiraceae bacterium]